MSNLQTNCFHKDKVTKMWTNINPILPEFRLPWFIETNIDVRYSWNANHLSFTTQGLHLASFQDFLYITVERLQHVFEQINCTLALHSWRRYSSLAKISVISLIKDISTSVCIISLHYAKYIATTASLDLFQPCFKIFTAISCGRKQKLSRARSRMSVNTSRKTRPMYSEAICLIHYDDVIMSAIAPQTTSLTIVYSTVYSWRGSRKTSKPRVIGLCSPVTSEIPAQRASNAENVPFDDVIMRTYCKTCEIDSFSVLVFWCV